MRAYDCRYFFLDQDGPALAQIQAAGYSIEEIEATGVADILNRNSFNGNEVVIDTLTGATQGQPLGTQDVFDSAPFIARTNGEGECCVNDGESAPTPVCFRNSTNPCTCYSGHGLSRFISGAGRSRFVPVYQWCW